MIKKVIHTGDIHIRNFKRQDEYINILNKFVAEAKEIADKYGAESTRIVVAGDLVHSKTELSPECYTIVSGFLSQLDDICKTIVIAGNHDITQNNNRLDALTAIFKMNTFKQTYYLDMELDYESGCVIDDNIVWCLYSVFSNFSKPNINEVKVENPNKAYIGLFHGDLQSARTDVGYVSERGLNWQYFNDIEIGMFGHIHRRQCIRNNESQLVYCGSLIQQDYGENISGHGYVLWDIGTMEYEEKDIENVNNGFYTFYISSENDIENDNEEILNL